MNYTMHLSSISRKCNNEGKDQRSHLSVNGEVLVVALCLVVRWRLDELCKNQTTNYKKQATRLQTPEFKLQITNYKVRSLFFTSVFLLAPSFFCLQQHAPIEDCLRDQRSNTRDQRSNLFSLASTLANREQLTGHWRGMVREWREEEDSITHFANHLQANV